MQPTHPASRIGTVARSAVLLTFTTLACSIAVGQPKFPQSMLAQRALTPAQAAAMIKSVKGPAAAIRDREVFAAGDSGVVKLTDQNVAAVLSKPTLTAEIFRSQTAVKIPTPAMFKGLGAKVETFALPTRYTAVAAQSAAPVNFKVALAVVEALHFDSGAQKFLARVAVGLINPENDGDESAFAQDVPVLIGVDSGDPVPDQVSFHQLHTIAEIKIAAPAPANPYRVTAMTALTKTPDAINVPIEFGGIDIAPVAASIRGFGLEETNLVIQVPSARGSSGETITVSSTRGTVTGSPAKLDASGSAFVVLRSAEVGPAIVTASSATFQTGTTLLAFKWPVALVVATLVGATLGSLLRSDARKNPGRVVVGILVALIVVAAFAAGVSNRYWGAPAGGTGDAVFFFVAAMSGYLGTAALSLFGGKGDG